MRRHIPPLGRPAELLGCATELATTKNRVQPISSKLSSQTSGKRITGRLAWPNCGAARKNGPCRRCNRTRRRYSTRGFIRPGSAPDVAKAPNNGRPMRPVDSRPQSKASRIRDMSSWKTPCAVRPRSWSTSSSSVQCGEEATRVTSARNFSWGSWPPPGSAISLAPSL